MGMTDTSVAASCGIGADSELDDVFLHFYTRVEAIPDSLRSVAEVAIGREDLRSLIDVV